MSVVRLGAVGYLNARPLVYGLDRSPRFAVRADVPSRCATLLHEGGIDVGLIPSIEYLHGEYLLVPDLAIASRGPVASVALYTSRPVSEIRSIALDASSRTSVALVRVLCAKAFRIDPSLEICEPDLEAMLARADAALVIGDNALVWDGFEGVEKIDLGVTWTTLTGLPFVYAFWAGRPGILGADDVRALQQARDEGVRRPRELAQRYFAREPDRVALGERYLRDNIKYYLGADEREGLERFYAYAAEIGLVARAGPLRFYPS